MVLGTLQTGQGFNHLDAIMAILGLTCSADGKFKEIERKVVEVIEAVARESCEIRREEKNLKTINPMVN